VKKLLALCVVGALALTLTGCPGPTTTAPTGSAGGGKTEPKTTPAPGKTEPKAESSTAEGTVVSADKDKITITTADKKEWSAALAADAKVMRDGKPVKAEDLKAGDTVKVTYTGKDKDAKATAVDAKPGTAAPPAGPVDATVTAVDGDKITIKAGDKEYVTDKDTKITVDGKEAKAADVKKDMKGKATMKDGKVTELAFPKP
jgi:hypothetical protein